MEEFEWKMEKKICLCWSELRSWMMWGMNRFCEKYNLRFSRHKEDKNLRWQLSGAVHRCTGIIKDTLNRLGMASNLSLNLDT